jgi:rhodanese-related sulfurtransferase
MPPAPDALAPKIAAERHDARRAVIVDIREPDEYARIRIRGSLSRPLSTLQTGSLDMEPGREVVFVCRSGMRTSAHSERLAAMCGGDTAILAGGIDAWVRAGLPVEQDLKAPLEIMRQVQIAAGSLVLAGVVLGVLAHPAFLGLSAFVGAGLTFAGVTGFCGMARLLAAMPWNRRAAQP